MQNSATVHNDLWPLRPHRFWPRVTLRGSCGGWTCIPPPTRLWQPLTTRLCVHGTSTQRYTHTHPHTHPHTHAHTPTPTHTLHSSPLSLTCNTLILYHTCALIIYKVIINSIFYSQVTASTRSQCIIYMSVLHVAISLMLLAIPADQ